MNQNKNNIGNSAEDIKIDNEEGSIETDKISNLDEELKSSKHRKKQDIETKEDSSNVTEDNMADNDANKNNIKPKLITKVQKWNEAKKKIEKVRKAISREEAISQVDAVEKKEYNRIQKSISDLITEFDKDSKTKYIADKLKTDIQTITLNIAKGNINPNGNDFVGERINKLKDILINFSNKTDIKEEQKNIHLDSEFYRFYGETNILRNLEDTKDNYYKINKEIEKVYRKDDSRKKKSFLQERNIVEQQRDIEFMKLYLNNIGSLLEGTDNLDDIDLENIDDRMKAFYKRMYFVYCLETHKKLKEVNLLNRDYDDKESKIIADIYKQVQFEGMTTIKIASMIKYFYGMEDDDKNIEEQKTGWNHSIKRSRTKKQTDFINKVFDLPKLNITAENIWIRPRGILLEKQDVYTKSIDLENFGLKFDIDTVKQKDILDGLQTSYEDSIKKSLNNSQNIFNYSEVGNDLLNNNLELENSFGRNMNLSAFGEQFKSRHALDRESLVDSVTSALSSDNFKFLFEQKLNINKFTDKDIKKVTNDYCNMIEQLYLKNNKIINHDGTVNIPELINIMKRYSKDKSNGDKGIENKSIDNENKKIIENFLKKDGTANQELVKLFLVGKIGKGQAKRKGFFSTLFTKGQRSKCFENFALNVLPFTKKEVDINITTELFSKYNKKFERKIDDSTLCHNIMVFMLLLDVDPRISVDPNKINKLKKDLQKVLDKKGIKFDFNKEIQKLKDQGGKIREDLTQGGIENFRVGTYLDFLKRSGICDKKNKGTMEDIFDSMVHLSNYKGNEFRYIEKSSTICIDYDLGRGLAKDDKLEINEKKADTLSVSEKQPKRQPELSINEKQPVIKKNNDELGITEKDVDDKTISTALDTKPYDDKVSNISEIDNNIKNKIKQTNKDKFLKKDSSKQNEQEWIFPS